MPFICKYRLELKFVCQVLFLHAVGETKWHRYISCIDSIKLLQQFYLNQDWIRLTRRYKGFENSHLWLQFRKPNDTRILSLCFLYRRFCFKASRLSAFYAKLLFIDFLHRHCSKVTSNSLLQQFSNNPLLNIIF